MSKRIKNQLTKDASILRDNDSSDGESQMETPQMASAEIMATRKIAGRGRKFTKTTTVAAQPSLLSANTSSKNSTSPIIESQMKSLNANFLKSINDGINNNPVADLSKVCNKYLEYVRKVQNQQIEVKKLEVPKVEVQPETLKTDDSKPNPFSMFASFGSSNTETTQAAKLAPKTIDIKPTPQPAPEKPDSDSESEKEEEVEIKGPTFKIGQLPTAKGGFKFGVAPPRDDSDSEDDIEIKGPTFTTNVKVQDSVFNFPKKNEAKDEDKPVASSFSFGAKAEPKPSTNGFSFDGSKIEESKPKTISFSLDATTTDKPASDGFSFSATKTEDSKPISSFSFGKVGETSNSFSLSKKEGEIEEIKTDTPVAFSASAFSFGNKDTSAFNFGASGNKQSHLPASAANTTASPSFNFGEKKTDALSTPTFNFDASTKTPASTFSFSKPSVNPSSVFNLGKPSEPAKGNPFSFGGPSSLTPAATTPFNFNAPTSAAASTSTTSTAVAGDDMDTKEIQEDNVKGNFAVVKLTEKVEFKSGEEEEDLIISKRSKITKFNTESKSYDNVGLGEMKVLKNKETGKSRILVRSEGSGNVVLNVLILKKMKYEIMGKKNNMIRVPSVNSSGELETYLLMVKTANDAAEVLAKLQEQQQS